MKGGDNMKQQELPLMVHCSPIEASTLLLKQHGGHWFFAKFRKSDGSIRQGTFRKGVSKGVKGTGTSPEQYGNIGVYEVVTPRDEKGHYMKPVEQFRSFKPENLIELHMHKTHYLCYR
jgi:hypothetical protein